MFPDAAQMPSEAQPPGFRRVFERRPRGDLAQNVLAFCESLRRHGLIVGVAEAMDALRILPQIDLEDWREFYLVLRSLFVSRWEELNAFDALFHSFWTGWGGVDHKSFQLFEKPPEPTEFLQRPRTTRERLGSAQPPCADKNTEGEVDIALYSPDELLLGRLFSPIEHSELRDMQKAIRRLGRSLATRPGRRSRVARKGHVVDLRRSMRLSLGHGGEILNLSRRRRRLQRLRLVLLLDVSRSMDVYSEFLLKVIYSLHWLRGRTESFVFGTDLKRVTSSFTSSSINAALANLSQNVSFWSGGTRIGYSFQLFNRKYAHKVLTGHTVLIILSDGLDTEAPEAVAEEMALMRQKVAKLIWLNPLVDTDGYEPLAGGMAAALPYVDVFTSIERLLSTRKGAEFRTA